MNFYLTTGHAYAGMTRLIADIVAAEQLAVSAHRFLNDLAQVYRTCEN